MGTVPAREFMDGVVHYLVGELSLATPSITLGTLPAGATILKPASGAYVNVAFNAGTNNHIDIGTTADKDFYATDLAGGSIAFVLLDEAVTQKVAADTTIVADYAQSGTAATTGSAVIVIAYVLSN